MAHGHGAPVHPPHPTRSERFAARASDDRSEPWASWWPQSRRLDEQLADLLASWPASESRIARVLYSPPDWDDRPRTVAVPGRGIKTGNFPHDDTHELVVTLYTGRRRRVRVIAPTTEKLDAEALLDATAHDGSRS